MGIVQKSLEKKLTEQLSPVFLDVINESHDHNVPDGSESHFRVLIVSDKFENLPTIKRHQMIYAVVAEEIKQKVHAFSQNTFTPKEWLAQGGKIPSSPPCAKKS